MSRKKPVSEHSGFIFNISSGVGDAIMAIPLLKAVHNHFPDVVISVIANRSTLPIFKNYSFIRHIYCADDHRTALQYIRFIRALKKENFKTYLGTIPSNTIRMMLIPLLSGIPYRIKHMSPHHGCNNYDFLFNHLEPIPENRHRIDCNLDLLKALKINIRTDVKFPLIELSLETLRTVERMLSESGYQETFPLIAVHPGCNPRAYYKRWPPEHYTSLLNQLMKTYNVQVLLVGGRDEELEIQYIANGLVDKPLNMSGKMNLLETACALSLCKFLISNDSGIMHLATAVNIPVFAIFGPTNDKNIGPYGEIHTVIKNGRDINSVTVEQVSQILQGSVYGIKNIS